MATKKKQQPRPASLGTFDEQDVIGTGIKITNAGDGLSKALAVDPVILHHHDKVYVVLETEVSNVAFAPVKDVAGVVRMHTLKAGTATIVSHEVVADVLMEQERRLEEAAGVTRLDFTDPVDDDRTAEEIIGT